MTRYRRIEVRLWGDEKFRRLSAQQPSGQALWIYLLTGPHTTSLPGLFRAGEAALAEAIRWDIRSFRDRFNELCAQGMAKADWDAQVVWVPNAIKYNQPANPNVVKSWKVHWDEIPECSLKLEAHHRFREFIQTRRGFAEVFDATFGNGFENRSPNGPANQEQKQGHQQDQQQNLFPPQAGGEGNTDAEERKAVVPTDHLFDAIAKVTGADPKASGSHIGRLCRLLRSAEPPYTPEEVFRWADLVTSEDWWKGGVPSLGFMEKDIGRVRAARPARQNGAENGKTRKQREGLKYDPARDPFHGNVASTAKDSQPSPKGSAGEGGGERLGPEGRIPHTGG
jgi:hypothetical protein